MYIERAITSLLKERLEPQRAVILFGSRRVGKTMLMRKITEEFNGKTLTLSGEDFDSRALLEDCSASNYSRLLEGYDLLAVDEAQMMPEIGRKLKLIVDEIPNIRVFATGSSSFDLNNQTGEPLVGRAVKFLLLPFSQGELSKQENPLQTRRRLEDRLLYGAYPDVALQEKKERKIEYLKDMVEAYLLKDLFVMDGIKNSSKLITLLRLVAYQVGSEISYDELSKQTGLSRNTVEKYLDLLSKVYVIYRVGGFARNLRKEISKACKWYFYDTGVRNAVINNFMPVALRDDIGALWENYIISERIKRSNNLRLMHDFYFWKTYDRQEIDIVEAQPDMGLSAFEVKWGDKHPKCPVAFASAYPDAKFSVVNRDNYLDFL